MAQHDVQVHCYLSWFRTEVTGARVELVGGIVDARKAHQGMGTGQQLRQHKSRSQPHCRHGGTVTEVWRTWCSAVHFQLPNIHALRVCVWRVRFRHNRQAVLALCTASATGGVSLCLRGRRGLPNSLGNIVEQAALRRAAQPTP